MPENKVVCYGEVLWDHLPGGKAAGGAPVNVAIRLQSLGVSTKIISKVGSDKPGAELIRVIGDKKVDISLLQNDGDFPTGEVMVLLDQSGLVSYEIVSPSAWDEIVVTKTGIEAVIECDAFVFGSLACRNEISRKSLFEYLEHAKYKVFDVNLRAPYYEISLLADLMNRADLIKMNDEELSVIAGMLGSGSEYLEENVRFIAGSTETNQVCITRGKDGAVFFTGDQFFYSKGYPVEVADTVGSGDSFLAALVFQLLRKSCSAFALQYACAVGAMVATRQGANPVFGLNEILLFLQQQSKTASR